MSTGGNGPGYSQPGCRAFYLIHSLRGTRPLKHYGCAVDTYSIANFHHFVGCLFIGLGLGSAFDFMPEALFFGLGIGFIAMAVWRYATKEW